jgi:hypothetical protein
MTQRSDSCYFLPTHPMNSAQGEAQQSLKDLLNKQQFFPPSREELHQALGAILPVLGPKRRGITPRSDQRSFDELMG